MLNDKSDRGITRPNPCYFIIDNYSYFIINNYIDGHGGQVERLPLPPFTLVLQRRNNYKNHKSEEMYPMHYNLDQCSELAFFADFLDDAYYSIPKFNTNFCPRLLPSSP